jgi:acyl-CoA reductase-like NAD-dependent aldehyde dehydrogenase
MACDDGLGRGKLLFRLAELVREAAAPRLAALETRDTGKIIRETSAQIAYVAEYYRYYAGLADKIEGAHLPIDKPDMEVWLRREPVGVVAAIVPWNSAACSSRRSRSARRLPPAAHWW